jgi:hypothetical protein
MDSLSRIKIIQISIQGGIVDIHSLVNSHVRELQTTLKTMQQMYWDHHVSYWLCTPIPCIGIVAGQQYKMAFSFGVYFWDRYNKNLCIGPQIPTNT